MDFTYPFKEANELGEMQIGRGHYLVISCAFFVVLFTVSMIQVENMAEIEGYSLEDTERFFAQSAVSPPEVLWNDTIGTVETEYFNDIIVCENGDYVAVGWKNVGAPTGFDGWIVRMNSSHDVVWERTYGHPNDDLFRGVVELSNGDFVICGDSERTDLDGDFWLFRVNSTGHYDWDGTQWNTTYGGGARERCFGVVETPDGGFAMCGETLSYGPGGLDAWLVKVDSTGSYLWDETYGTTLGSELFYGFTLCELGFACTGYYYESGITPGVNGYIVRTNSTGFELWNSSIGYSSNDYLDSIIAHNDGTFTVGGEARISGTYRYWVAHTNSTGYMTSSSLRYGGATAEHYETRMLNDGGFVSVGYIGLSPSTDLWVQKLDADLNFVWDIHVGDTLDDIGYTVTQASDGTIIVAGDTGNYGALSGDDGWILEISNPLSWGPAPSDQQVEAGTQFRYDINASSTNGIDAWWLNDTTSFSIDSNGVLTNSTSLGTGSYPLRVFVNDTIGDWIDANITIDVADTIAPTWAISVTDQNVEFGDSLSYQMTAMDAGGISQYSVNDTTNFVIDNTGLLENKTTIAVGIYGLNVTAGDASDNEIFAVFKVIVADTTEPTWITQPADQQIIFGQALSFQVNASDLSGIANYYVNDTTNFVISAVGLITNTTTLLVGDYGLNISVEDIYGNTLSRTIRIRVLAQTTTTPTTTPTETETTPTDTTPTTAIEEPPDNTLLYIILFGVIPAIIVVVIIASRKRKGG